MSKRICVIGTGYVGLLTAVGLSDFGNTVIGVDIDQEKIDRLNQCDPVIYEPGINEYLDRNLKSGRLKFTTAIKESIESSEVIFIAVGTPSASDGDADLTFVNMVVADIARYMTDYKVVVIKSTVPVGTNRKVQTYLTANSAVEFDVVSNPEFLREGVAVYDFFHPDRVVVGAESERAKLVMQDIYRSLTRTNVPFVWCGLESAEIIKYASNGFLALKIGFVNQLACLAEEANGDIQVITKAMGMDGRIGPKFLHAGPGYGGSCFPKDTLALSQIGRKYGTPMSIIESVIRSNDEQKERVFERLVKRLGGSLVDKTIAILGLAFKAETDDIRDSAAIPIVDSILKAGGRVQAHDPKAMSNFSKLYPMATYSESEYDAVYGSDAILILTEWNEYRSLDLERIKSLVKNHFIFDTRNVVDVKEMMALGFSYDLIGRKGK